VNTGRITSVPKGKRGSAQQRQGRRPTLRSQRTREEVLLAAAECIAGEGFAAASTNRIAERAGVSWGVLQYHFGDKESLLTALLEYGMEKTEEGFRDMPIQGDSLEERIANVVDGSWYIFASPLARAASEVLVSMRRQFAEDGSHGQQLQSMADRLTHLARQTLGDAIGKPLDVPGLDGVFLAALRGFEQVLLLQTHNYQFPQERATLSKMICALLK
jgi:AcrR family transcriptional regulator